MGADMGWLIVALLVLSLAWLVVRWRRQPQAGTAQVTAIVQRLLQPRTPDDCPACRQTSAVLATGLPPSSPPQPWRERKSRRGAPKRITTAGFAGTNHRGAYYRSTDAQIHALVGDGTHGKHERIQPCTQIPLANPH